MEIKKMLTTKRCYIGENSPKYIVIHETDNYRKGAGAATHAKAMANGELDGTVHYYVDDHEIYQTLAHENGAYAVGKSYGASSHPDCNNRNSISIEICVNPDSDYTTARKNCIDLTRHLIQTTGIPASRVIRHYDAKAKWCPRKMMDSPQLWTDFKNQLSGTSTVQGYDKVDCTAHGLTIYVGAGDVLNVRKTPGNGDIVKTLRNGERIGITETTVINGTRWYKYDAGWVSSKYVFGWVKDCFRGNKWWYLKPGYKWVSNGWLQDGAYWYYFGADGYMVEQQWQWWKGLWYYLQPGGYMAVSKWVQWKGKWYYLTSNGGMAVYAYVAGKDINYWVNKDGAWEPQWDTKAPDLKKYKLVK